MEGENEKLQETTNDTSGGENPRRTRVGFPQAKEEKKGKGRLIFIILAILALVAVGVWLLFGRNKVEEKVEEELSPTVTNRVNSPTPTVVEIEREGVKIQVLNGSGISGAAGDLQDSLEDLGYTDITVGNASNQDYTETEVTYSSDVESGVKNEITDKLKSIYEDVSVSSDSVSGYDIQIITGYPKGYTPSPTSKPSATATPTPTANETETPTPTP